MKCSRAALFLLLFVLGVIAFALGPADGQERAVTYVTAEHPPYENMFYQYGQSQDVDGWRSYHAKDGQQLSTEGSELSSDVSATESEIENPAGRYGYGYKGMRVAGGLYGIGSHGYSPYESAQNSEEDVEESVEEEVEELAERHDYVYDYHDYKARYGYSDELAQSVADQSVDGQLVDEQPVEPEADESSPEQPELTQSPQVESEENGEVGYYYPYELAYDAELQGTSSSDGAEVSEEVEPQETEQENYSYDYESEYGSYYKNGYQYNTGTDTVYDDTVSDDTEEAAESDPYAYDYSTYYQGEQASTVDETVAVEDLTPEPEAEVPEPTSAENAYDYSQYYPYGYRGHYADQNWYGRFRQSGGVASEDYRGYSKAYPVEEHAYVEPLPKPAEQEPSEPEQSQAEAESPYEYTYEYSYPVAKYGNDESPTEDVSEPLDVSSVEEDPEEEAESNDAVSSDMDVPYQAYKSGSSYQYPGKYPGHGYRGYGAYPYGGYEYASPDSNSEPVESESEADAPETDDQAQTSTYYYEWDVAEETAPTVALSDWLPSQLLADEDREVLRILKRCSEDTSGMRRATLSDHIEYLGMEAIEFATQFQDDTGIDVLGLADDMPGAAAMIATFRLIERGEVETEQAVEVLREGLLQLDNQWLSELAEMTSEPVDQAGQWRTVRKAVDCLACASVGHLTGISRLVWRNLHRIDWLAWAYRPSDEPEIGNLEASWERF